MMLLDPGFHRFDIFALPWIRPDGIRAVSGSGNRQAEEVTQQKNSPPAQAGVEGRNCLEGVSRLPGFPDFSRYLTRLPLRG